MALADGLPARLGPPNGETGRVARSGGNGLPPLTSQPAKERSYSNDYLSRQRNRRR